MSVRDQLRRMLIQQSRQAPKVAPPPEEPLSEFDQMSFWEKAIDVLSRPNYMSANFAKALVQGSNPFKAALRGMTGEERTTYSDVLKASGMNAGMTRSALGFAGDVFLDPTTYLTAGAGAGVKTAVKGATKVLKPAASAARATFIAEKGAKLAELLPVLAKENPASF